MWLKIISNWLVPEKLNKKTHFSPQWLELIKARILIWGQSRFLGTWWRKVFVSIEARFTVNWQHSFEKGTTLFPRAHCLVFSSALSITGNLNLTHLRAMFEVLMPQPQPSLLLLLMYLPGVRKGGISLPNLFHLLHQDSTLTGRSEAWWWQNHWWLRQRATLPNDWRRAHGGPMLVPTGFAWPDLTYVWTLEKSGKPLVKAQRISVDTTNTIFDSKNLRNGVCTNSG